MKFNKINVISKINYYNLKIIIIIMKIKMDLIIGNSILEKILLHISDKIVFGLNYYLDKKSL